MFPQFQPPMSLNEAGGSCHPRLQAIPVSKTNIQLFFSLKNAQVNRVTVLVTDRGIICELIRIEELSQD